MVRAGFSSTLWLALLASVLGAEPATTHRSQIRIRDPLGPFQPPGQGPQTPPEWMALDGSLWVEDGVPYLLFCDEWVQITDAQAARGGLTSPAGS